MHYKCMQLQPTHTYLAVVQLFTFTPQALYFSIHTNIYRRTKRNINISLSISSKPSIENAREWQSTEACICISAPTPHKGGTTVAPPTVIPTPTITVPSPPFPFDPNSPPFTCTYWKNHPTLIWGLFGYWGSIGSAFGISSSSLPGDHMSLLQALSNKRMDWVGELYRQGTAALLNSMAHTKFPYTTTQVRDSFVMALSSDKATAAQPQLFKLANEGKLKPTGA